MLVCLSYHFSIDLFLTMFMGLFSRVFDVRHVLFAGLRHGDVTVDVSVGAFPTWWQDGPPMVIDVSVVLCVSWLFSM